MQAGEQDQREPGRPQPDVGQQNYRERGPALCQPGDRCKSQALERGVHDPELIVEHPADHDGGDDRRHHQRQQNKRLNEPTPGKAVVEHQRDRQAEHQRNGRDHETEGIGKNDVAEFRVAEDVKVVGESDPGPLGIMQRPIAKAGIGSRENGDDLE